MAIILAESDIKLARSLNQVSLTRQTGGPTDLYSPLVLCLLGDKAESEKAFRALSHHHTDACPTSITHREDHLIAEVLDTYRGIFADAESVIAEITAEARQQIDLHREDANRIRAELAELDGLSTKLGPLLGDPELPRGAKSEISLQLDSISSKRVVLKSALDRLTDRATPGRVSG